VTTSVQPTPTPPTPASPDPPRTGPPVRRVLIVGAAVLAAILAVAVGVVLVRTLISAVGGDGRNDRDGHRVVGAAHGRDAATLDLVSGVTTVTIRSGDFGGDMYRVSTPDDGAQLPHVVDRDDRVEVQLSGSGEAGPSTVLIELDQDVAWHLRVGGGANEVVLAMGPGGFAGLDLASGVTTVDATLSRPAGTAVVRIGGGASEVALHLPQGVPARVTIGGGASQVRLDAQNHSGVPAGSVFANDGWDLAPDRFDVDASTGVATVLVDRR
jgi:hypothetical protein